MWHCAGHQAASPQATCQSYATPQSQRTGPPEVPAWHSTGLPPTQPAEPTRQGALVRTMWPPKAEAGALLPLLGPPRQRQHLTEHETKKKLSHTAAAGQNRDPGQAVHNQHHCGPASCGTGGATANSLGSLRRDPCPFHHAAWTHTQVRDQPTPEPKSLQVSLVRGQQTGAGALSKR